MPVDLRQTHYRFGIEELLEATHGWHAAEDADTSLVPGNNDDAGKKRGFDVDQRPRVCVPIREDMAGYGGVPRRQADSHLIRVRKAAVGAGVGEYMTPCAPRDRDIDGLQAKLAIMEYILTGMPPDHPVHAKLDDEDRQLRDLALRVRRADGCGPFLAIWTVEEVGWFNRYIDNHMVNDPDPTVRLWRVSHMCIITQAANLIADWSMIQPRPAT